VHGHLIKLEKNSGGVVIEEEIGGKRKEIGRESNEFAAEILSCGGLRHIKKGRAYFGERKGGGISKGKGASGGGGGGGGGVGVNVGQ